MMDDKLYGVSTKSKTYLEKSRTKTINGLNLPPITDSTASQIGTDLRYFSQTLTSLTRDTYESTELLTRQEVM